MPRVLRLRQRRAFNLSAGAAPLKFAVFLPKNIKAKDIDRAFQTSNKKLRESMRREANSKRWLMARSNEANGSDKEANPTAGSTPNCPLDNKLQASRAEDVQEAAI